MTPDFMRNITAMKAWISLYSPSRHICLVLQWNSITVQSTILCIFHCYRKT